MHAVRGSGNDLEHIGRHKGVEDSTHRNMELAIGRESQGRTATLSPGDALVLTLQENPTTGYVWTLEGGLPVGLQMVADHFLPPEVEGVGAGGRREIRMRAVAPGGGDLILRLRRPWETANQDIDVFSVQVVIRDP